MDTLIAIPAGEHRGKPVTKVVRSTSYPDARAQAESLRASRTEEERRAGVEYRIVAGPVGDTHTYVERFHNW